MRAHVITAAVTLGLVAALTPAPAAAGVDWFGFGISSGGFHFSLGYSDYPEYSSAWHDPSWSLNYNRMLDGYGEWVYVAGIGQVWHPFVAAQWQPFTYGRWVWTSLGWTWVAYEPWGYVPFHYGDWAFTSFGWVWVPGSVYRSANVVWFTSGSMIGWMPCAPRGWSNAHRGFWRGYDRGYRNGYGDGYADGWRDARYATWVDWRHMGADNVASYAYSTRTVERQVSRVNLRQVTTPDRREVERRAGVRVPEASISRREVRMGDHTVQAVRVEGFDRDVQRHARETVTRGLATEVSRQLERREPVTRSVAAPANRSSAADRRSAGGTAFEVRNSNNRPVTQPRGAEPSRVDRSRSLGRTPSSVIPSRPSVERAPAAVSPPVNRSGAISERRPSTVYRSEPVVSGASRAPQVRTPQTLERREPPRRIDEPSAPRTVMPSNARSGSRALSSSRSLEVRPRSTNSRQPIAASRSASPQRSAAPSASSSPRAQSRTEMESRTSSQRPSRAREVRRPTPRRQ